MKLRYLIQGYAIFGMLSSGGSAELRYDTQEYGSMIQQQ